LTACSTIHSREADASGTEHPDVAFVDAFSTPDAFQAPDAVANNDAATLHYERDVQPLLEASACGDCHTYDMDYEWVSSPGTTWCTAPFTNNGSGEHRWLCIEVHARTQMRDGDRCITDFYHRHGEPCFTDAERDVVLRWAAAGFP